MNELIAIIVIGTSIWVLIDAKTIGVKKGQIEGFGNLGPWGWFFGCLLLWIIGFPLYLAKRGELKRINAKTRTVIISDTQGNYIEQIERLAKLKENGIITEEEFNNKKKALLS